ncbi:MAG: ABC transporter ATP-binding protein, partial [Marinobacter sp. 34-60-7]
RQALTMALQNFDGAIVLVSHDRHLLRNTVDEFWLVADGQVQPYDGDLEDYERWLADRRKAGEAAPEPGASAGADAAVALSADERKARKRQEAEIRQKLSPFRKQQSQLEKRMEALQKELAELEQSLSDPSLYDEANKVQLKEQLAAQAARKQALEDAEAEWLEISETVESLEAELTG